MSDIDDRMEAQEAEYEMGLMREQEEIDRQNEEAFCQGCGKALLRENAWMEDGCPCNAPKGCNTGNQTISDWRNELRQELSHQLERTKAALALKPGGCRILSKGDNCDCTLCKQSNEIERLKAERDTFDRASTYWWVNYCRELKPQSRSSATCTATEAYAKEVERLKSVADKAASYVELFNSDSPGIAAAYGELAEAVWELRDAT